MNKLHSIIIVAGPTASGKSDFAVELALKHNGEIISADSRQIYKGLDIGTGKITKEEMKGVKHHMLDVCELSDDFSVATYKKMSQEILRNILQRGKTPIICGGTGQYIDTFIFNQNIPEVKPNTELRKLLEKKSTEELYQELLKKDAVRAEKIDRHNKVRIIRALEIIEELGHVPEQKITTNNLSITLYLMDISRELLRDKIKRRLEVRLKQGMIKEVIRILKNGYTPLLYKKFGIEYVAIAKFLNQEYSEEEMKEDILTKSMQYAKRQQTWNKKYKEKAILIEVLQ